MKNKKTAKNKHASVIKKTKKASAAKNKATDNPVENRIENKRSAKPEEPALNGFSNKELDEIRKNLILLKREIFKEIDASIKEGSSKDSSEYRGDNYDIASNERDRELSYMLGDRERQKIREIDNALLKIKEGTYGVCNECGEPISKKRLKVIPYSNLCINCQSRAEEEGRAQTTDDYLENLRHLSSLMDEDDAFKDSDE
ncbi:MAG: TraR/DksA family transcriptional regulator [Deltaproteobacteria bacterium]|nr:TraR/DksA family transcriptional regulator [Deltaproteobacteria bacterium]